MEDISEDYPLRVLFAFKLTYKIFPEVLYKALKVNATFLVMIVVT